MPQVGLTGSQQMQQTAQYAALSDLLSKKKELGDALDAFCKPAEDEYASTQDADEVEEHLNFSWKAIISQAAQLWFKDERQQKLVEFVRELQKRSTLQKNGQTCEVQGMTVWRDLPTFGWSLRDAWNLDANDDSDAQSKEQWINVNAFTAALLASNPQSDDLDLSLFCVWTVRDALEESTPVSNVAVAAAATWFVFAAPTIQKLCDQGKSFDANVAKAGSALQTENWNGFSQGRWEAWKNKIEEMQGQMSDDTTKQLLEQAGQAINEPSQS